MKAILNEVGITSILVTHDQEEAFDIADQVAVFNRQGPGPSISPDACTSACTGPCSQSLVALHPWR